MKKLILPTLTLLLSFLLLHPTTYAQEKSNSFGLSSLPFIPNYIGLSGSYVREDIDSGNIEFDDTGAFGVKLGFHVFQLITLEINFSYFPEFQGNGNQNGNNVQEKQTLFNFMATAKFPFALSHQLLKPSFLFGMGVFHNITNFEKKLTGSSIKNDDTDNGLSVKFGVELELYLSSKFSLALEGSFVQLFGNENKTSNDVKFFLITISILYKF